mmetsp:Transcript_34455/g.107003  ORF Transcript_34455/g.107003 Transcript_34455/m.107003 type:complete len:196 (+) Transcript_34455:112-699(+)
MVLDEVAVVTGQADLSTDDRVPYGCGAAGTCNVEVDHKPLEMEMANTARSLYYLRRFAEDLSDMQRAPRNIRNQAADVAKYAHDLEFFARQLALGMKMPVAVDEPYLPIDEGTESDQSWKYLGTQNYALKDDFGKVVKSQFPIDVAAVVPLPTARPGPARAGHGGWRGWRAPAPRPGERSDRCGMASARRAGHFL